jgi:hypothetical protein
MSAARREACQGATVKDRVEVALTFPAASTARTAKLWAPLASVAVVNGEPQGLRAPESTRHWKVEPALLDVNENVGVESWTTLP